MTKEVIIPSTSSVYWGHHSLFFSIVGSLASGFGIALFLTFPLLGITRSGNLFNIVFITVGLLLCLVFFMLVRRYQGKSKAYCSKSLSREIIFKEGTLHVSRFFVREGVGFNLYINMLKRIDFNDDIYEKIKLLEVQRGEIVYIHIRDKYLRIFMKQCKVFNINLSSFTLDNQISILRNFSSATGINL